MAVAASLVFEFTGGSLTCDVERRVVEPLLAVVLARILPASDRFLAIYSEIVDMCGYADPPQEARPLIAPSP